MKIIEIFAFMTDGPQRRIELLADVLDTLLAGLNMAIVPDPKTPHGFRIVDAEGEDITGEADDE